jgi:hypothetical protein
MNEGRTKPFLEILAILAKSQVLDITGFHRSSIFETLTQCGLDSYRNIARLGSIDM